MFFILITLFLLNCYMLDTVQSLHYIIYELCK